MALSVEPTDSGITSYVINTPGGGFFPTSVGGFGVWVVKVWGKLQKLPAFEVLSQSNFTYQKSEFLRKDKKTETY